MNRIKGFALPFTIVVTILIILVVGAIYLISSNDLAAANVTCNGIRAHQISEAGLAKKFMDLRGGDTSSTSGTFTLASGASGTYSVTVSNVQGGAFPVYKLYSTGTYKGVSKSTSLTLKQISCARYGYLSNSEDQLFWWGLRPIWFITGDVLNGPFHSNDQLNISEDPTFNGPVSSTDPAINYYHGGPPEDNPDFRDSLTLGAPSVALPTSVDLITPLKTKAQESDGLYLTGNSVVTLLSNGTMNVTNSGRNWINHNVPLPANNALFVDNGYVDISGVLNGKLTVGTSNSIYVVNNILYASDPRTNPASADMLGLVSQNNVYVDSSAPFDLEIDAYIVALNSSFTVANYTSGLKGTLTILGGITQQRRGPIGTFNASTGQRISGYTKDYNYDDRLADSAPAYFPPAMDNNGRIVYLKILWEEY